MSLNEYCAEGPLSRLDPRAKTIALFLYIFFVVLTQHRVGFQLFFFFLLLLPLLLLSGIPFRLLLRRLAIASPFLAMFVLFVPFLKKGTVLYSLPIFGWHLEITQGAISFMGIVLAKALLSLLALALLTLTTPFPILLKGLQELRLPKIWVMIFAFMYRYIFLIGEEAERMRRAYIARYFGGWTLRHLQALGGAIGSLFLRSYERSERVYQSMLARSFQGDIRTISPLRFGKWDALFLLTFASSLIVIKAI